MSRHMSRGIGVCSGGRKVSKHKEWPVQRCEPRDEFGDRREWSDWASGRRQPALGNETKTKKDKSRT